MVVLLKRNFNLGKKIVVNVIFVGQTACDLAQTQQMQQILEVQPVRSFHRNVSRFEGPLLRRMRIIGWRMVWVSYFSFFLMNFN